MKTNGIKKLFISILLISGLFSPLIFANSKENAVTNKVSAVISPNVFEIAKKNEYWKLAQVTGKQAQVVFMSITPKTNPKNEIGMETHQFDQVVFVVEGEAKTVLNGKKSMVTAGDMIFIPKGIPHNFINLNMKKAFKIISVYSATDIPKNAAYEKKSDTLKK